MNTLSRHLARILTLSVLIGAVSGPTFGADSLPQAAQPPVTGAFASKSDGQLIAALQAAIDSNPTTKGMGANFTNTMAAYTHKSDYAGAERDLNQMKALFPSNPDIVDTIEELIARFRNSDAALKAKRNQAVDAIVKDITDKFNSRAPAAEFDGILKRIADLGGRELAYSDPYVAQRLDDARTFAASWQDYLVEAQAGNQQQAANALAQLVQLAARFPIIPRSTLIALKSAPVSDEAAKAEQEKFNQFVQRVDAAIDAAKVPSDLDAILVEVSSPASGTSQPSAQRSNMQRLEGMKWFVRKWQDYLNDLQLGRSADAQRILQELLAPSYDVSFYPRSKILARESSQVKAGGRPGRDSLLMDPEALTLENLGAFSAQIDSIGDPSYLATHREGMLKNALTRIIYVADQVRAGDAKAGVFSLQGNWLGSDQAGEYFTALSRIADQIRRGSEAAYLDVPASLAPNATETSAAYLDRVLQATIASKDWRLAYRVVELRKEMGAQAGFRSDEMADYIGFRSMMAGMDKEAAMQWTDAVVSYSEALNSTGQNLPVKEIGERLARIQKEHPADFEKGKTVPDYPSLVERLTEAQHNPPRPRQALPGTPVQDPASGFPHNGGQTPAPTPYPTSRDR
jgi:hypothetical protein